MTQTELKHLYQFAGLPFSLEESDISELKKLLLLEIKSGGGILTVEGKEWTRNDVLTFFNTSVTESFDLEAFFGRYPWMKEIYEPETVRYRESVKRIDFDAPDFQNFRRSESKALEQGFERQLRQRLAKQEDHHALALLHLRKVFDIGFQDIMVRHARQAITIRCNEALIKLESSTSRGTKAKYADFLRFTQFYDLLEEIALDDPELLELVVEVYSNSVNSVPLSTAYSILKNIRRFQYSGAVEAYLDEIQRNIERLRKKENSEVQKDSSFNVVYIVLVVILLLARLVFTLSRH